MTATKRPSCDGQDPELWFRKRDRDTARAICNGCPVRAKCLAKTLELELEEYLAGEDDGRGNRIELWGMFGGLDENQRAAMLKARVLNGAAA